MCQDAAVVAWPHPRRESADGGVEHNVIAKELDLTCVCVCVCLCVFVCVYVCVCVCIQRAPPDIYVCMYVYTCYVLNTYECKYVCMYMCIYMYREREYYSGPPLYGGLLRDLNPKT
jgi:hypothetical protein